ncbi:MAG: hypothetical protein K0Q65_1656 [Clostridia bacterium]|nr:hypothetical protein [Clostridia bacterium]
MKYQSIFILSNQKIFAIYNTPLMYISFKKFLTHKCISKNEGLIYFLYFMLSINITCEDIMKLKKAPRNVELF